MFSLALRCWDEWYAIQIIWTWTSHQQSPRARWCTDQMAYRIAYYEAKADTLECHSVSPSALDPTLYTHIHFAGAQLSTHFEVDVPEIHGHLLPALVDLKKRNPDLKVILSVGNFNDPPHTDGCYYFSKVSSSQESREAFATSAKEFLTRNNLDGIDLVMGYPEFQGCLAPEEKVNFGELVKLLRKTLDSNYTISMAIPPEPRFHGSLDFPWLAPYLNYTVLRTRNFQRNFHGTLYSPSNLTDIDVSVAHLVKQGMPSNKVIMEVLAGGPLLALKSRDCVHSGCKAIPLSDCTELECNVTRRMLSDVCVNDFRRLTFHELLLLWIDHLLRDHLLDYNMLSTCDAVKLMTFNTVSWVAFDSTSTISQKVRYAFRQCLGGYALWAVHEDSADFQLSEALLRAHTHGHDTPVDGVEAAAACPSAPRRLREMSPTRIM